MRRHVRSVVVIVLAVGLMAFFLRNANNRLIGAVAGLVISEESDKFAYRKDCL